MAEIAGTDHQTRDELLSYIMDRPGVSFSRLMNSLKLNEGTLRYHLNYLEKKELIRSRKEGRRRLYFYSLSESSIEGGNEILGRYHKRVLTIIRRSPGIGFKDIMGSLDLAKKEVKSILKTLEREHLVWSVENRNGLGFEVVTREKLIKEMLYDLLERFLKGEIDQTTFLRLREWLEEEKEYN